MRLLCARSSCSKAFRTTRERASRRLFTQMELSGVQAAPAPWHLRGQPHSALQADKQFPSVPAGFKQQSAPQQQMAGFYSHQAAPAHLNANELSASDSDSSDSAGPVRVPLKLVVADAVKRWFNETLSEARRGDVKQQALLSQMYADGYGCKQDVEQSKVWGERARLRGYQMSGVYDAY
ncbi:hypothetical protein COO60DRAFT_386607 [Scenedesmus sp. NREL 46B-D3]|nr:hypothetical protein COO60DRAFT_386607 [Scenedesmus sp. NREL 46B-D3]